MSVPIWAFHISIMIGCSAFLSYSARPLFITLLVSFPTITCSITTPQVLVAGLCDPVDGTPRYYYQSCFILFVLILHVQNSILVSDGFIGG